MPAPSATPRVILITGTSSGFGLAMATHLHAQGHMVFGTRRAPPATVTPQGFSELALDLRQPDSIAAVVREVQALAGRLDVLINNAGNGIAGALEDMSIDEVRTQMETNFFGTVQMIQAVVPLMRQQHEGRIIMLGSLGGRVGLPFQSVYSASKFALEGINEALRLELAGSGVQSALIRPGDFRTGFTAARTLAAAAEQSVHSARFRQTLSRYEQDEIQGADPQQLAALVARLVQSRRLRPVYQCGHRGQLLGVNLKAWMPASWFEYLMKQTYGL
ncbi:SDR family oxidoreductase [Thalassolituus sp. LLYu03]|uniref:SDR family oxidoreductase n=1 Tax=Thalassolituus sp. LLYu03 TaxID=3421656 RepID=UPI003D2DCF7C